ncbi:MAG: hypothetical protein AB8B82_07015 [Roseovarius sp.]
MKPLCLITLLSATSVAAQPMQQIAPQWDCALMRHMRVATESDVVEMDPSGRVFQIDFNAMTVSSAFVEGTADIVQNSHHAADATTYNILVNAWPFGTFPSVFMEQDGIAWSVGGSGRLDNAEDVWVAVYRCAPNLNGS